MDRSKSQQKSHEKGRLGNNRLAAVLLAGGMSRRMGRDKARLQITSAAPGRPAQTLLEHQLKTLRALSPDVLAVSARAGQVLPEIGPGIVVVPDSAEDQGPLAGIAEVFQSIDADWYLFLAVDLPGMTADFLHELVARARSGSLGQVAQNGPRWEPLAAVYPRTMGPLAAQRLEIGQLSLQGWVDTGIESGLLAAVDFDHAEKSRLFFNVNTPEDLEQLDHPPSAAGDESGIAEVRIVKSGREAADDRDLNDVVAREEPLELRVEGRSVAVVMRTPGHDRELAAGFLLSEGIIRSAGDIFEISECPSLDDKGDSRGNVVEILLRKGLDADLDQLTRHVFSASSCGICGKATIDSVFQNFAPLPAADDEGSNDTLRIRRETILGLPAKLRQAQENFEQTGGLHASALFTPEGDLIIIREDVGRHNALDKVLGEALLEDRLPLSAAVLLVSGRISFELMQKALSAGIPVVAGISAPTSLAVDFAQASGQTLIGFLRKDSFNLYAGAHRLHAG